MKKISIFFFIFCMTFFLLTGCTDVQVSDATETEAQTEAPEPIIGREDRAILDEYKNITPSGTHDVQFLFINAGKADAVLVQIDDRNYLIDTGTAASVPVIEAALSHIGVQAFDGLFISHTDNDHTGGYEALAEKYPIGKLYTSSISSDWNKMESLRGETERVSLDPGAAVELADGVYFEVLGPIRYNPADDNNNSLVLRLRVNGVTALFTGDMMHDEETSLMYSEMPLKCDILKVGYHGQKQASSQAFIEAASPSVAVISTDRDEDEGSAHKSVLKLLETVGSEVHITDESELGVLVTVGTDGTIRTENFEASEEAFDIRFVSVSKEDQVVVIENCEEEAVDLTGWYIISVRGREMFAFPEGCVVEAGEQLTIACREYNGEHDLMWEENRVWHREKKDTAVLIDPWGNRVHDQKSE